MKATTVRLDEEVLGRIDELAGALSRSRAWVIKEAIDRYLDYEEWFAKQVEEGLKELDEGAETIPHDHVMKELREKIDKAQR